ncbi:MAG: alpha/beta hydrolase [Deltaproteobacteria bacterium]|nr:alpha/beta hydrolase [Deltaproteobacteria bacterium]
MSFDPPQDSPRPALETMLSLTPGAANREPPTLPARARLPERTRTIAPEPAWARKHLGPVLAGLLLAVTLSACGGTAMNSGPDAGDGADDSQELSNPTTTLKVHYPSGSAPQGLAVRGSAAKLNWSAGKAMTAQGADTFVFTTRSLKSGTLEWKPLLGDQAWSKGPNYTVQAGGTSEVWPHFVSDSGTVERVDNWWSNGLQDSRPLWIYKPPSYAEQTGERFPVVYMHDGQNLFDPAYSFAGVTWQVAEAMNAGVANGTIREAIVIGVGNTSDRIWEYTPSDGGYGGGGAQQYLSFLIDELKPQIDQNLRTLTDRGNTVMIGSSLGGLMSGCTGVWRPDVFGVVGLMSPSTWWDNTLLISMVQNNAAAQVKPVRVYVDSGNAGNSNDDVDNTTKLAGVYAAQGIPTQHVIGNGDTHTESSWARRLPGALRFLLGAR